MQKLNPGPRRLTGAAIVESVIALPVILLVGLSAVQWAFVHEARATAAHAALMAARAGSLQHADVAAIRRAFAQALLPLYSPESSAAGLARTFSREVLPDVTAHARVRILNPTREAFVDFGETVNGERELPVANLDQRSTAVGSASGLNIQDANLLRVQVTYGHPLTVPFVGWIIARAAEATHSLAPVFDARELAMLAAERLPITVTATVRMHSRARLNAAMVSRGEIERVARVSVDGTEPAEASRPPEDAETPDGGAAGDADSGGGAAEGDTADSGTSAETGEGTGGDTRPATPGESGGLIEAIAEYGASSPAPAGDDGSLVDAALGGDELLPEDGANLGNPAACAVAPAAGAETSGSGLPGLAVGNPVHVVTGNKYQREIDLSPLPGPPAALAWSRHYNSAAAHERHGLGAGWRHGYQARLIRAGDGRLVIRASDGRSVAFHATDPDGQARARRAGDGYLLRKGKTWRWHLPDGRVLAFDRDGHLAALHHHGATLTLSRDANGALTAVIDALGRRLTLRRGASGRIVRVLLPGGGIIRYGYGPRGNLILVHTPDGGVRRYHYEDARYPHALTGISRGHSTPGRFGEPPAIRRYASYSYDDRGRAIRSSHAGGVGEVTLDYRGDHTVVTDARGRTSRYHHSRRRGVALVTAIEGPGCSLCAQGNVRYTYSPSLQLTSAVLASGTRVNYRYDGHGRLVRATYEPRPASGRQEQRRSIRFRYRGESTRLASVSLPSINPAGRRIMQVHYDESGRPAAIIETGYAPRANGGFRPISRQQSFGYGRHGRLAWVDGYRNVRDLTRLTWDAKGRLAAITYPDGGTHRILARDAAGRPTRTQTDNRPPLTMRYDARGRIAGVSNVHGELTLRYGGNGRLEHLIAPDGSEIELDHDAAGRLIALTGATGSQRFTWSRDNRLVARAWHDADDHLLARAEVGHSHPPASADLASLVRPALFTPVADPGPSDIELAFDALGRLSAVTDARGNVTRYGRDDFGRRVFIRSPDTGLTRYAFDGAGHLREKIDATGERVGFTRDSASRLIRVTLPERKFRFGWTNVGGTPRLTGIHGDFRARETRTFDTAGRLTTLTQTRRGRRYTTHYHYDATGSLVAKTLPGGAKLRYHYHQQGPRAGALASISLDRPLWWDTPVLSGLNADTDASTRAWRAANGLPTRWKYHDGRLRSLTIGALHDFRYHHDRAGRIIGIDDGGDTLARYRFDAAGRLDLALTPAAFYGYRYDANGNRTASVVNGEHWHFDIAADSNRLLGVRRGRHSPPPWDASVREAAASTPVSVRAEHLPSGEMTRLGARRLVYNANGQPIRLLFGNRLVAEYRYNARAQRTAKILYDRDGNVLQTRYFLYERGRLATELNGSGKVLRHYLYFQGKPVAVLVDGRVHALHTDHRGAPIAVTNPDRDVIWRARYAPFGAAAVNEDPDGDGNAFTLNLRLPGQYADAESGLYYNHHRYYDPHLGRYVSSDPLGLAAGLNTYAYAANDPINHIDPSGLLLFAFDGTTNGDTAKDEAEGRLTNVVQFRDAYRGDPGELAIEPHPNPQRRHGEHWFYIVGAGREDRRSGLETNLLDAATGNLTGERVIQMAKYLYRYLGQLQEAERSGIEINSTLNIDIVGFSRGASEVRIFANLIDRFLAGDDTFTVTNGKGDEADVIDFNAVGAEARAYLAGRCLNVNLRFLGLWDTVSHIGVLEYNDAIESHGDTGDAYLGIPASVDFTAHAVAVNERRALFDAWSIHERPSQSGGNKIEKGFVGAHSDIGGGYENSDLSDVAFMWMVQQAVRNGGLPKETIDTEFIAEKEYNVVTDPVANDEIYANPLYYPGRYFRYLDPGTETDVLQKNDTVAAGAEDLDFDDTLAFLEENIYRDNADHSPQYKYDERPRRVGGSDRLSETTLRLGHDGTYLYQQWLLSNYGLDIVITSEETATP